MLSTSNWSFAEIIYTSNVPINVHLWKNHFKQFLCLQKNCSSWYHWELKAPDCEKNSIKRNAASFALIVHREKILKCQRCTSNWGSSVDCSHKELMWFWWRQAFVSEYKMNSTRNTRDNSTELFKIYEKHCGWFGTEGLARSDFHFPRASCS